MNLELIRKLEKIAHDKIWNADVSSEDFPNSFNVEFAELIVRECARIADETQFKLRNYPVSIAIENHFLGANNGT